jgi:hypothetical protein
VRAASVSSPFVDCNVRGECREDYISKTCVFTHLVAAFLRRGAEAARLAHNQEAVGSNPTSATRCGPRGTTGPISLRVTVRLRPQRPTIRSGLTVAFEALKRGWLRGALPTQRDVPASPARRRVPPPEPEWTESALADRVHGGPRVRPKAARRELYAELALW